MLKLSLRAARVNAGLTQQQVEQRAGFARSTLTRWESGKGFPRLDDLIALCELYGVRPEDIRRNDESGK